MKVYIIRYEELISGEYSSGISYVFDTLDKAEIMLRQIKQDEIHDNDLDGINTDIHDLITENGFIIDYIDNYTKYVIEEMEVK